MNTRTNNLGKRLGVILGAVVLLSALTPGVRATDADAGEIVAAWIATVRDGGRIYPGGRQRGPLENRAAEILPLLIEGFADEDSRVGHTFSALAALAPEDVAVELLGKALEDERDFVREFSGVALGHLGSPRAVPLLITALRQGRLSLETLRSALERIGGEQAMDSLIALLAMYSPATRAGAAQSLGGFTDPRAAKALAKALRDSAPDVRKAALGALCSAGGPEHAAAVVPILKAKDPALRLAAVNALCALGGQDARDALVRHAPKKSEETIRALEGAVALGASLEGGALTRATRLLGDESPAIRARAAGVLGDHAESRTALLESLAAERDGDAALALGRALARRREKENLPVLRELADRFPDRRRDVLLLLDRAGDPELTARLRSIEPDPDAPAGGPLFLLAFRSPREPDDLTRALEIARTHPRSPGLLADAYLLAVAHGSDAVEALARALSRLPAEDLVIVPEGPARPAIRDIHLHALRILTGRAFGYDPRRTDQENRNALRRALKWWLANRRTPDAWSAGAGEAAATLLASRYGGVREGALRMLASVGRWDDLARLMSSDASPAVRVRAARFLVEAKDVRGVAWLCSNFADEGLVDWSPFSDSPRATRREAAHALWRAANRRFSYDGGAVDGDTGRDLVLEEQRRWRIWWKERGGRGFDAWFRDGCARAGLDLPEAGKEAETLARALAGNGPRYVKENLLDRLRRVTGRRVLPIDIADLDVLAPGENHPIFAVLSHRWLAGLR